MCPKEEFKLVMGALLNERKLSVTWNLGPRSGATV